MSPRQIGMFNLIFLFKKIFDRKIAARTFFDTKMKIFQIEKNQ